MKHEPLRRWISWGYKQKTMPSVTGYAKMCKSTLHYSHHNNHSRKHDDDANYDHDGRLAISSGVAAHEFGANESPETTQVMEPGRVLAPNNFIPSKMRCRKRSMSLHRYQLDNVQSQLFHSQWARKPQGDTCVWDSSASSPWGAAARFHHWQSCWSGRRTEQEVEDGSYPKACTRWLISN